MADEEEEQDFSALYDDDDDDDMVTCWCCYSCGKVEAKRPTWGGQCPRCGSIMEEEQL